MENKRVNLSNYPTTYTQIISRKVVSKTEYKTKSGHSKFRYVYEQLPNNRTIVHKQFHSIH